MKVAIKAVLSLASMIFVVTVSPMSYGDIVEFDFTNPSSMGLNSVIFNDVVVTSDGLQMEMSPSGPGPSNQFNLTRFEPRGLGVGFPVTSESPGRIGLGESAEFSWETAVTLTNIEVFSSGVGSFDVLVDDQFVKTLNLPSSSGTVSFNESITGSKIQLAGNTGSFRIQSLSVNAVPEPNSIVVLMSTALLSVVIRRRRKIGT